MEFEFKAARKEQADQLLSLYRRAAQNMNDHQIYQWNSSYPDLERVLQDVDEGSLFILEEEGTPVGAVTLNQTVDIPDEDLEDRVLWKAAPPFAVVHRLCIHPQYQGRGLGKNLLRHSLEYGKKQGWGSLRLMVLEENRFARGLYTAMGFAERGQFLFNDAKTFIFMERIIE